ncbi:MAG TPA: diaminopimelate decarboxylase [Patescibacteria group bacterium]|nr:diaminopimelate decarboxylase [Patescibacteria group bacterium]
MPMPVSFKERLYPILPDIAGYFSTPFYIYDETGIKDTCRRLLSAFDFPGVEFQEFFAVKANPNPRVMEIFQDFGFGFDCSSTPELRLARDLETRPEDIMFTSNNTSSAEFREAEKMGGCILNLDDITLIDKVPHFPELICFRYNPGERRSGNEIIGNPVEAKYGVSHDQIVDAYRLAREKGARRFGIHTMICSNELNYEYMVETVRMLCELMEMISGELGIKFEFMNMGGGLGVAYEPGQQEIPLEKMAEEIYYHLDNFRQNQGYLPKLFLESGRYMAGPHGVLVTKCLNQKHTYKEWRGVDATMADLMRPGMYWPDGGYHHIEVFDKEDHPEREAVNVVGSLCENCDQFARDRELPPIKEGDLLVIQDCGAHGHAMGFNYNARLRPKELMFREGGEVELIRRAQTHEDYVATLNFEPKKIVF